MIPEVEAVVEEIGRHRARFETFSRSLADDELQSMVPPDREWQVKDYISHLASIDIAVQPWFEALSRGDETPRFSADDERRFDVDRWNQEQIEKRRTLDVGQILEEAARHRARLVETMGSFQASTLEQIFHFPGDAKRPPMDIPFSLYLSGWAKHDPMHVHDMLRALPGRSEDPELREWLACLQGIPGWRPEG